MERAVGWYREVESLGGRLLFLPLVLVLVLVLGPVAGLASVVAWLSKQIWII